ncbi:MAG: hypothetical protein SGARI_002356, partial [Bacillariaceae sp.]
SENNEKSESSPIKSTALEGDQQFKPLSEFGTIDEFFSRNSIASKSDQEMTATPEVVEDLKKPDREPTPMSPDEKDETSDTIAPLPSKQASQRKDWMSRHTVKTFSSLDDEVSLAETFCTTKESLPGIFGHMNQSSGSIETKDVLKTLAPFLNKDVKSPVKKSNNAPGSLSALLASSPRRSTVPEPSLCPVQNLQNRSLDSLLEAPNMFSTLAGPSVGYSSNSENKTLDALLDTDKKSLEESAGDKVPLSLDALLDAQPRNFPSTLPEPSICPPRQSFGAKLDSKNAGIPSRAFEASNNKPQGNRFDPSWDTSPDDLCFGGENFFETGESQDTDPNPGTFGDTSSSSSPLVDKASLVQISKHIKIHRALGPGSADVGEDPKYLQLDLSKMGD